MRSFERHKAGDAYGWLDEGIIEVDQVMCRVNSGIRLLEDLLESLKASFAKTRIRASQAV